MTDIKLTNAAEKIKNGLLGLTDQETLIAYVKDHHGTQNGMSKIDVVKMISNLGLNVDEPEKPYVQGYNELFFAWGAMEKAMSEKEKAARYDILIEMVTDKQKKELDEKYTLAVQRPKVEALAKKMGLSLSQLKEML